MCIIFRKSSASQEPFAIINTANKALSVIVEIWNPRRVQGASRTMLTIAFNPLFAIEHYTVHANLTFL